MEADTVSEKDAQTMEESGDQDVGELQTSNSGDGASSSSPQDGQTVEGEVGVSEDTNPAEKSEESESGADLPKEATPTDTESASPQGGEEEASSSAEATAGTSHLFDESWSKLSKDVVVDKVKGVIYGQAIGDALGLATEFLTRKAARTYYKTGPKGYDDIIPDFHRSRWDKGDWTDDTDQMLLILQMINSRQGHVDKVDFANRIYDWMRFGFKELGDLGGMGIGMTVKQTLTHPGFLKDPHISATEVWERSGKYLAANGAIMRTSILGVLNFNDLPKVVANTTEICKVTHADPRCVASCVAVTTAIAMILKGEHDTTKKDGIKKLVEAALKEGQKVLEHKDQQKEMKKHMNSSLDDLKLDDKHTIGYTFKALGAGFYGLRHMTKKSFRDVILEVIMEAGDADSNAAVCGALTGCVVGFKSLPQDLLQFPHRDWLDQQVDSFLTTIGLKD